MPIQTMMILGGVVASFVVFASLLAWADHHSSSKNS